MEATIPTDITGVLSEFGLPAVVVTALAVGLVRGAKAFEEGASDAALKYVSALLTGGGLTNFGKVGATLVPAIFDRVFGTRPLSIKFILRSFLATTLFWIILLAVRHPNWGYVWQKLIYGNSILPFLIPLWYCVDLFSLVKARLLLRLILGKYTLIRVLAFFILDVAISYTLCVLGAITIASFLMGGGILLVMKVIDNSRSLLPLTDYVSDQNGPIELGKVLVPSTLLTSVWTFLFLLSSFITMLLIPIDHLRRFTAWWFDVEKHPLTAIAKVAGTLIIIGALLIKAVRWFA